MCPEQPFFNIPAKKIVFWKYDFNTFPANQKTHPGKGHSLHSCHRLDWDEGCPFEQGLPILFEQLPC